MSRLQHIVDRLLGCTDARADRLEYLMRRVEQVLLGELNLIKEMIMSLQPEVQALVDAVAANNTAIAAAVTEITSVEGKVTDLSKQVADLQAQLAGGKPVDAEDLAAIVQATTDIGAGMASLKGAMPVPVEPPAVPTT
jgi:predicted  nucleic acid-binding Zn-ribbon protein